MKMKNLESIVFAGVNSFLRNFGNLLKKFSEIAYNLFLMMLVGCSHRWMGKPLTIGGATYRICPDCGAYRLYDLEKMRFCGVYFYQFPPPVGNQTAAADGAAKIKRLSFGDRLLGGQLKQAA